jgi:hypothetical protein
MASTIIRSTYALDVESVRRLEAIARRWNVSKSEALRRAIRSASEGNAGNDALDALDALQKSLRLTPGAANDWADSARAERRASSRKWPGPK